MSVMKLPANYAVINNVNVIYQSFLTLSDLLKGF